jgi:hypothetical protein
VAKKKNIVRATKYPTYRSPSNPTPAEELLVCERCGQAAWVIGSSQQQYHSCRTCHGPSWGKTQARMRKAVPAEYTEALRILNESYDRIVQVHGDEEMAYRWTGIKRR